MYFKRIVYNSLRQNFQNEIEPKTWWIFFMDGREWKNNNLYLKQYKNFDFLSYIQCLLLKNNFGILGMWHINQFQYIDFFVWLMLRFSHQISFHNWVRNEYTGNGVSITGCEKVCKTEERKQCRHTKNTSIFS